MKFVVYREMNYKYFSIMIIFEQIITQKIFKNENLNDYEKEFVHK
ncbi:hypothetical protein L292_1041 [Acinetobacter junii CIP 107470 = MTCC 11364]|uniref:Uncharacterized protein n=1 Tax=Acinetobacter junii CIP 107470 = MTCC 11364 TaxID=1217666 RepID=S7Y0W7_ACIJU|nr:hypothetical protein F953_00915 [Acinetobacter junii CIP 107470 = MTCC 11364]EPR81683.1 hypothetical protein L292_1041 [Acinetobacter junii CIP 107470 = MTCC 11364]